MFNPKLILNNASELNLTIKTSGDLHEIIKKLESFKPKKNKDFLHLSENESDVLKNTQLDLNQLIKIRLIMKILRLGIKISNSNDLNELKEKKIEDLINIDPSVLSKTHNLLLSINKKHEILEILKNTDNNTIVIEYNLMPQTTLMMLFFSILIIVSSISSYLGYSHFFLKEKYSFFNEIFAFWTMLLGGLISLLSINYFFQNVIIKIKQIKNKNKIYNELATNFFNKRERNINKTILRLNKKKYEIERKYIQEGSILKLKEVLIEETNLLNSLYRNFN